MNCYIIEGGRPLRGEINLQGSKNSALPILAATLLNRGVSVIENCPDIKDVETATEILKALGCTVSKEKNRITVDSSNCGKYIIKEELMCKMRSSVMFLGGLLAVNKQAVICYPGGCCLGERPIDIHISALKAMGASIYEIYGSFYCLLDKGKSAEINLSYPSVGATENIMICATLSKGRVVINNPAREPEIVELANFINKMGGNIKGAGTEKIIIKGVRKLKKYVSYTVEPDRIACITYMTYGVLTGGKVKINNAPLTNIINELEAFSSMGCKISLSENSVEIEREGKLNSFGKITTMPYPGFPTDSQPFMCLMGTVCEGESVIEETVFENRFVYASELRNFGINALCKDNKLYISECHIKNGKAYACDLRGGAALTGAALMAEGESRIYNIEHIDRGYEKFEENIKSLGGKITRYYEEESAEGIG